MIPSSRRPLLQNYEFAQELPNGLLGPTVMVTHKVTKVRYVCKICKKSFIGGADSITAFKSRLKKLSEQNFSFVIPYTDILETEEELLLIRPFTTYASIQELTKTNSKKVSDACIHLFRRIVTHFIILHRHGIFPSSVKPTNIFVDLNMNIQFTDLYDLTSDLSWALQTTDTIQLAFFAPEFFTRNVSPSSYSDVWSMIIIFYFMWTNSLPFSTKNVCAMIRSITQQPIAIPIDFPAEYHQLMVDALNAKPQNRPPMSALLEPHRPIGRTRRDSVPVQKRNPPSPIQLKTLSPIFYSSRGGTSLPQGSTYYVSSYSVRHRFVRPIPHLTHADPPVPKEDNSD